jgi:hypothetical protein
MNTFNRYFSTLWGILSLASVAFWLKLQNKLVLTDWIDYSEGMLLIYLIYNSRSLRSKQALLIWLGIASLVVALAFKFMHWPFTIELLAFSGIFVVLSYTYFFSQLQVKRLLDFFKLSWVYFFVMSKLSSLFSISIPESIAYVSPLLLIVVYIQISYLELQGKDQSELKDPERNLPEDVL